MLLEKYLPILAHVQLFNKIILVSRVYLVQLVLLHHGSMTHGLVALPLIKRNPYISGSPSQQNLSSNFYLASH